MKEGTMRQIEMTFCIVCTGRLHACRYDSHVICHSDIITAGQSLPVSRSGLRGWVLNLRRDTSFLGFHSSFLGDNIKYL